ncbi:cdkn1a interacting zinc finger protein 1b isoform X2 [Leuresthes tenuis]|uniref:cdkn1a interacting zinc finger protein 1b isoform X2 n=1 Tax=Leuresthes tenuis TaxID=355514 RepID=UPI003B50A51A
MVKRTQRTDRCFLPAAGGSMASVGFPVCAALVAPPQQVSETGGADRRPRCSPAPSGEHTGSEGRSNHRGPGSDEGSGEAESKRMRQDGNEEAAASANRDEAPGSCGAAADVTRPDQQGAAEDSRAAELQSAGSLKVTIQRRSDCREFGPTDRTADRHTAGLHCHVCNLTCSSPQVFQDHMSGGEHLRKLQQITHCIRLSAHTLLDRGRRSETKRWCDTCQTHFTGDVILHRRTKQHKVCKQLCRPFCPVCKQHFRTPRKFVEHMKSAEHKQQVLLEEAQEEELITVDAVGCFKEEEEEEEEVDVADEEEEEDEGEEESTKPVLEMVDTEESDAEEHDPHVTYGSSFVVPVRGFVCRLCNKFFYGETAARHTHCRTRTHYLNLQSHRAHRRIKKEDDQGSDLT